MGRSGSWPGSCHVLGHARAVDKAESAHIFENQEAGADGDREDIQHGSHLLEDLEGVEWAIVSGLSGAHLFGLGVGLLTWDPGAHTLRSSRSPRGAGGHPLLPHCDGWALML